MVKDEADVVAGTLRHMAGEVDWLIVADNGSTDGTRDILTDLSRELPLTVIDDPDPAYYQSVKMSWLAARAADAGAAWIVPFDADELWWAPDGRIADVLAVQRCPIVCAALTNHLRTAEDVDDPDPFRAMVWRQPEPGPLPKVAFRWEPGAIIHQGNHGVTLPSGGDSVPALRIRHFPYRSANHMVRKAVNGSQAYKLTDLPEHEGQHWRDYGALVERGGEEALHRVFREHFFYERPAEAGLIRDPAPYMRWW